MDETIPYFCCDKLLCEYQRSQADRQAIRTCLHIENGPRLQRKEISEIVVDSCYRIWIHVQLLAVRPAYLRDSRSRERQDHLLIFLRNLRARPYQTSCREAISWQRNSLSRTGNLGPQQGRCCDQVLQRAKSTILTCSNGISRISCMCCRQKRILSIFWRCSSG